jgi:hypothetical protein
MEDLMKDSTVSTIVKTKGIGIVVLTMRGTPIAK